MIASTLTIEEKDGGRRRLVLRGAGLPAQGASWKTEQRLVTKWYAGNPWEATQHVLGPIDPPSEWRGIWNTTRLIGTPPSWYSERGGELKITQASTLRDLFDGDLGLVRSGALLRVTWATDDGRSIAREGRISTFEGQHVRMDDITWSATFVWVGRGNGPPRATQFAQDDVNAAQRAATAALNDLASTVPGASGPYTSIPGVPLSATNPTLGRYESITSGVVVLLDAAARTASDLSFRISSSWDFSGGLPTSTAFDASVAGTQAAVAAVAATSDLSYRLGQIPAESLVGAGSSPSQVASVAAYVGSVHGSAQAAEAKAQDLAAAARKRRSALSSSTTARDRIGASDVRTTVRAKQGETFASIALRLLGSADLAGAIAAANGVPSYQVAPCPGSIVLVPVLSAADVAAP